MTKVFLQYIKANMKQTSGNHEKISLTAFKPRGGGSGVRKGGVGFSWLVVINLRVFSSSCSKPICVAKEGPKTYFVFTPNSRY